MDTFIHLKKESRFMKYLHTMIRVGDIDAALDFFVGKLGMVETRRKDCLLYTSDAADDQ